GKRDAVRRIPREHAAPLALAAVHATLVPTAVDLRLDDGFRELGLADVMFLRPPDARLARENLERFQLRGFDLDRAPDRRGPDRLFRAGASRVVRHDANSPRFDSLDCPAATQAARRSASGG